MTDRDTLIQRLRDLSSAMPNRTRREAAEEIEDLTDKYQNVCRILNELTPEAERLRAALKHIAVRCTGHALEIAQEALGPAQESMSHG